MDQVAEESTLPVDLLAFSGKENTVKIKSTSLPGRRSRRSPSSLALAAVPATPASGQLEINQPETRHLERGQPLGKQAGIEQRTRVERADVEPTSGRPGIEQLEEAGFQGSGTVDELKKREGGIGRTRKLGRRTRRAGVWARSARLMGSEGGMATAEYAIATLAAVGLAGLLVVILRSEEVRGFLLNLIRTALSLP